MILVLRRSASPAQRAEVLHMLTRGGLTAPPALLRCALGEVCCVEQAAISPPLRERLRGMPAVERLIEVSTPYQLASRIAQPERTMVRVGTVRIGGPKPVVIAGPCSVESEEQMVAAAQAARDAGADLLRGGAYKPRTSPYSFQGLGLEGLRLLDRARAETGLPIITEVLEPGQVSVVAEVADIVQIGTRSMQNFPLLKAAGRCDRPVLLKRGFSATIEEWLLAAEYILAEGNSQVVLCERGIRSFDPLTRNVLDLACVPLVRRLTHLPILVDPSHATGRRELIVPMATAAVAAGADGVIVEMHPEPDRSISDAAQTIGPDALRRLVRQAQSVAETLREALLADDLPLAEPALRGSECW
jgi:3-deoxy-7-phosphoheptulonate synthase